MIAFKAMSVRECISCRRTVSSQDPPMGWLEDRCVYCIRQDASVSSLFSAATAVHYPVHPEEFKDNRSESEESSCHSIRSEIDLDDLASMVPEREEDPLEIDTDSEGGESELGNMIDMARECYQLFEQQVFPDQQDVHSLTSAAAVQILEQHQEIIAQTVDELVGLACRLHGDPNSQQDYFVVEGFIQNLTAITQRANQDGRQRTTPLEELQDRLSNP